MRYYLLAIIVIAAGILGCDSDAQVVKNIERLRSARDRLTANPHDDEALATILRMLQDSNGINRVNAASILGETGEKVGGSIKDKALPPLIKMLDEGDPFDRRGAAIGIRGFGVHAVEAIPALRRSLFPSDGGPALISTEALGKIGEPAAAAVPDLLKVVEENATSEDIQRSQIRRAGARSLGQIGPKAIAAGPTLVALLKQTNDIDFKIAIGVAVIRIDPANAAAMNEIEKLMEVSEVRERVRLIDELRDAGVAARPALRVVKAVAANDKDEEVRGIARQLLTTLEKSE